jgi:RNA polymerase sigma factor (sigma-70 family)
MPSMKLEGMEIVMVDDPSRLDAASERYLHYARSGDTAELDTLIRDHLDQGYAQARRMLGSPLEAEDAVQEAVLQLLRGCKRYTGSVPFAACWARVIHVACHRVRLSRARRNRREIEARRMAQLQVEHHMPEEDDSSAVLRSAVNALPDADQAAIDLHYFAGLSQRDAATALGVSENAFSVRLHRARNRLQRQLTRRSLTLSASALAAALSESMACAAPASLIANISALTASASAGAALPSTTLPIGVLRQSWFVLQGHLMMSAIIVAGLIGVGGVLAFAGKVEDGAPAHAYWTGPAKELLRFIDPARESSCAVDVDAVRTYGRTVGPTSAFHDPVLEPTIEHIIAQYDLLVRLQPDRLAPVWRSLDLMHGLAASSRLGGDDSVETAVFADFGAGTQALQKWSESISWPHQSARKDEFSGFEWQRYWDGKAEVPFACLFSGTHVAFGWKDMVAAAVSGSAARKAPAEWMTAPIQLRLDASEMMRFLVRLDRDGSDLLGIGQWLPQWRSAAPALAVSAEPTQDRWSITSRLTGVPGLPLRPMRADFARLAQNQEFAGAACAFDAAIVEKYFALDTRLGLGDVGSALGGDLALVIDHATPIPAISLLLSITDRDRCHQALTDFLANLTFTADPKNSNRWSRSSPAGLVTFSLLSDHLIISTRTDGGESLLANVAAGKQDESLCALANLDLARAARTWLPVLYATIRDQPKPMVNDLVPLVQVMRSHAISLATRPGGVGGKTLSAVMNEWFAQMRIIGDNRALQERFADEHIRMLKPGLAGDFDTVLDTCLALYTTHAVDDDVHKIHTARHVVAYRLPDGLHVSEAGSDGLLQTVSPEEFTLRTAGMRKMCGPDPEQLAVLPLASYEFPMIDHRWLPDIEALTSHLPAYRMTMTYSNATLAVEEFGYPFAAAGLVIGVGALPANKREIMEDYHSLLDRRDADEIERRNVAKIDALLKASESLATTVNSLRMQKLPMTVPAPSALLAENGLTLDDFAPWFSGRTPSRDELDRLGVWEFHDWPSAWKVELEPGWQAYLSTSGVQLTSHPFYQWGGKTIRARDRGRSPQKNVQDSPPRHSDF